MGSLTSRVDKTQKFDKSFTKNDKFSKSLKKIVKICINLRVFSERLFVSSHGGMLMGVATVGRGATAQWGGGWGAIVGGGGHQLGGGSSTSRTALHTIIISLQNSLS